MIPFTTKAMLMILLFVASLACHAARPATPCQPAAKDAANPQILVIPVDRTAIRDDTHNARVVQAVAQAARAGMRLVLWGFGGNARPLPTLLADTLLPTPPDAKVDDLNGLITFAFTAPEQQKRLADCALNHMRAERDSFLHMLRKELAVFDGVDSRGSSPIILTLQHAIAPFAAAAAAGSLQVLLVSDGFEYSGAGALSFYPTQGKFLSTSEAVEKTRALYPGSWSGARITISGLGVQTSGEAPAVSALTAIWSAIIKDRGGVVVELTPSSPQLLETPKRQR